MKIKMQSGTKFEVVVSFRHVFRPGTGLGKDGQKPFTEARIVWANVEGFPRQAYGVARVHPNDQAQRRVGRKVALARALKVGGFDREERRQVWAGLLERGMRV